MAAPEPRRPIVSKEGSVPGRRRDLLISDARWTRCVRASLRKLLMTSIVAAVRLYVARTGHARERTLVMVVALTLVILRSSAFVFGREPQFDSDQAIVGLMAKHMSEFRALPVFFYGQHFMLAVEAWLAAPLFFFAGASVTVLKLPLLGMHLAITVLLLVVLERELKLRPVLAFVPTLFFIAAPTGTTELMLQTNGGNVEPFLYVLLLWLLRHKPFSFGAMLGLGFLNREFTVYGLAALLLIDTVNGDLLKRRNLQDRGLSLVSLAAVFVSVESLKLIGNPLGPGTSVGFVDRPSGSEELLARVCWEWTEVPRFLATMFTSGLSTLYTGGADWLWLLLGAAAIAAWARVVPRLWRGGLPCLRSVQFPAYLIIVGLLAAVTPAVSRCGAMYPRYTLLALIGLVGVTALYLKVERRADLRAAFVAVVLFWATFNAAGHIGYAVERYTSPPTPRAMLVDYLVSNGIRFARSDYWTAYYVTFLTDEEVIVASDYSRIQQYQDVVAQHADEAVAIGRVPCEGGHQVEIYYVCPPLP